MTILVTGATGSLGASVVARLRAEGRSVAILTRRPFRADALFGPDVAMHEWHPASEPVPAAALSGVTGIVHLMGEPLAGWPVADRRDLVRSSRIATLRGLAEALGQRGGPIRLVVASLALGLDGDGEPVSEAEMAATADGRASVGLPADVRAWEDVALGTQQAGVSVAIVRFGLIAAAGAPLATLVALARRGLVADLRGLRIAAVDVADAAAMLSGLVQHTALCGLIHGAAPEAIPGEAITAALAALSPLPAWTPPVPVRLLRRSLGHATALLSTRRPPSPARLLEAGADFASRDPTASLERAITALAAVADVAPPPWSLTPRS